MKTTSGNKNKTRLSKWKKTPKISTSIKEVKESAKKRLGADWFDLNLQESVNRINELKSK